MSEETNGGDLSGIASAISRITSDPDMMSRLRAAVNGEAGEHSDVNAAAGEQNGASASGAVTDSSDVPQLRRAPAWSGSDRRRLLEALRPFLSAERREKADSLINVIALLDSGIIDVITKGGR